MPDSKTKADSNDRPETGSNLTRSSQSRRAFLRDMGVAGAAATLTPFAAAEAAGSEKEAQRETSAPLEEAETSAPAEASRRGLTPLTLTVNGKRQEVRIDPRASLLDTLRETLHLTGTKKGCDHGQCGACTVHVDGHRALSCLSMALSCEGHQITTIEGLGTPEKMHPMQAAFVEHDGFQCGYCTSGQIMSAVALAGEPIGPNDADVKEAMSGNICRCGAYANIIDAIQQVRRA